MSKSKLTYLPCSVPARRRRENLPLHITSAGALILAWPDIKSQAVLVLTRIMTDRGPHAKRHVDPRGARAKKALARARGTIQSRARDDDENELNGAAVCLG